MIQAIRTLGDPALYEIASPVVQGDPVESWVEDLHDTLMDYRARYGAGRAIAAPQIGIPKRLIYMFMDKPYVLVNPELTFPDPERYSLLDDCMSFPGLVVRVSRYRRAQLCCCDERWNRREMTLEGDWSELVQHEYDHLDGILATMRAEDSKSFYLKMLKRDF